MFLPTNLRFSPKFVEFLAQFVVFSSVWLIDRLILARNPFKIEMLEKLATLSTEEQLNIIQQVNNLYALHSIVNASKTTN